MNETVIDVLHQSVNRLGLVAGRFEIGNYLKLRHISPLNA